MSKFRDISPLEFSYLASDSKNQSYFVNQFVVEGTGQIEISELRKAVIQAAEVNPGIRLKLKGRWYQRYWDSKGKTPAVYEASQYWNAQGDKGCFFQNDALNCRKGSTAEVILIPGENSKIIFRVHHAVCDGGGTMHWIQEVFRALSDKPLKGSKGKHYDLKIVEDFSIAKSKIPAHDWSPILPTQLDGDLFESQWLRIPLECPATKLLPKLIFTLSQIAFSRSESSNLCFRIPSDLRRLIEDDDIHMGNLTGAIDITITKDDSIPSIYSKIVNAKRKNHDLMAFGKNLSLVKWLPKVIFTPTSKYFKKRYEQGYCNISGIVSYVSRIDLADFSTTNFKAESVFGIPIPLEGVSVSCGIIQNNQNIQACLSVPKSFANREQLKMLGDKLKLTLEAESNIIDSRERFMNARRA